MFNPSEVIVQNLLLDEGVKSVVGDRVYCVLGPAEFLPPGIVFRVVSDRTNANIPELIVKQIAIDCYGNTTEEARSVYESVRDWIDLDTYPPSGGGRISLVKRVATSQSSQEEESVRSDTGWNYIRAACEIWLYEVV